MNENNRKLMIINKLHIYLILMISIAMGSYSNLYAEEKFELQKKEWKKITRNIDYTENLQQIPPNVPSNSRNFNWLKFDNFKILFYILIVGIIGFLIFLVLRSNLLFSTIRYVKSSKEYSLQNFEENIQEADLDKLLMQALSNQNYLMALRIHFLILIKTLNQNGNIVWKKEKTNGDYLIEMMQSSEFQEFAYLTLVFEKVWYGDLAINEKDYQMLSRNYENFNLKISKNA